MKHYSPAVKFKANEHGGYDTIPYMYEHGTGGYTDVTTALGLRTQRDALRTELDALDADYSAIRGWLWSQDINPEELLAEIKESQS